MSAEDVPGVIEKVQAKLNSWKSDQAAQTQKNIDAAKKRIEELEKTDEEGTNGDKADKTDKVAEDLSKATISEKEEA
ncbi:hypothetical protein BBAD15_g5363 [Beauveria bassiana D1-5]|uniref:Uncharacterized protein n=1 Tax=Beauveria bassiana D1-5 TaxID=1245745 RepID=A0A0A2W8J4_BEABA|nr:hypothetical protein BBAD15_g5363 [Beauveria bassiana D1-5]